MTTGDMKKHPKKIGTISINKYVTWLNYGAVLHSYAFQQVLNKKGYDCKIIDYVPRIVKGVNLAFPLLSCHDSLKLIVYWLSNTIPHFIKYKKFERFYNTQCRVTKQVFYHGSLDTDEFDTYIAESDIIWSPQFNQGFDEGFFCAYPCMKEAHCIAYAASIADTNFSDREKEEFRELLKNFDSIALREYQAAEFTRQFTDKEVTCVLDPTLLLDGNDYAPLIKSKKRKKKYVLIYSFSRDANLYQSARTIAESNGWDIVEITRHWWKRRPDYHVYTTAGIEDFLWLFKNAEAVITNTFHGTAFSLVFKKEFYAFSRNEKDSRMTSILHLLGMEELFINGDRAPAELPGIDYDKVYERLQEQRRISMEYLEKALGEQ